MAKREEKRIYSTGPKRKPLGYGQEQEGGKVCRFQQESSENIWEDNVQTREQIEVKVEIGIEIEILPENSRSKTRYALKKLTM